MNGEGFYFIFNASICQTCTPRFGTHERPSHGEITLAHTRRETFSCKEIMFARIGREPKNGTLYSLVKLVVYNIGLSLCSHVPS